MNGTLRSNSVQNTKVISYIKLSSDICFSECKIYLFSPDFLFSVQFCKAARLVAKTAKTRNLHFGSTEVSSSYFMGNQKSE